MEFNEKLQQLRKSKNLTQEELAEDLFVTRTAISKWESGRGFPSIDSIKAISKYFLVSIDELVSSEQIIDVCEKDNKIKMRRIIDVTYGIVDCLVVLFIFLPFFGYKDGDVFYQVPLYMKSQSEIYILCSYWVLILSTFLWGILTFCLQKYNGVWWLKTKNFVSLGLSLVSLLIFIASVEPYVALFTLIYFIIKVVLLFKIK